MLLVIMAGNVVGSNLSVVPLISFGFVETYARNTSKASGKAHLTKGYKYFSEGYIHSVQSMYIIHIL
jgi:hypothetical protein